MKQAVKSNNSEEALNVRKAHDTTTTVYEALHQSYQTTTTHCIGIEAKAYEASTVSSDKHDVHAVSDIVLNDLAFTVTNQRDDFQAVLYSCTYSTISVTLIDFFTVA